MTADRSSDSRDVSDVMMCGRSGTCGTSERADGRAGDGDGDGPANGAGLLTTSAEERNEEARGKRETVGRRGRVGPREARRRERSGAKQSDL